MWIVYIIQSVIDERLYTGITIDLDKRLLAHNAGKGAKATKPWRPWFVVHVESYETKGDALKREATIKKFRRTEKLELIRRESTLR